MNRRDLLRGAFCLGCAQGVGAFSAFSDEPDPFICTTIDPPRTQPGIALNALNGAIPLTQGGAPDALQLTPYGTSFIQDRWEPALGMTPARGMVTLGVAFLDGSETQRSMVRSIAPQWIDESVSSLLAFRFDVPADQSQVRVSFDPRRGNNSKVGIHCLKVPKYLATTNLAECSQRGILHEFGHVLGLLHEHSNPDGGIAWNEPVVIADMAKKNWSEKEVRDNIFFRYDKSAACVGDPTLNLQSVMIYSIPATWTLNGVSTELNTEISDRDRACVAGLYRAPAKHS